jgi:hypothetical protein
MIGREGRQSRQETTMTVVHPGHDILDVVAAEAQPNALLPLAVGPAMMVEMSNREVARGGSWRTVPVGWQRYDRGWASPTDIGDARLIGTIYVLHGTPSPYDAVIHRVTVTPAGAACGWTPELLADDALALAGLRLADCGRVSRVSTPAPKLVRIGPGDSF